MTSRSEQLSAQFTSQFTAPFSAMGKSQFEAQLGMLQAFGARAIESTEQLLSLNLRASRTSVEQATGTFKQLLDATNPRDVIAVGSRAQGQWHYLFEYGRELLNIASGAQLQAWSTQHSSSFFPALQFSLTRTQTPADAVSQVLDQVSIATADATTVATEIASAAADVAAHEAAAAYQAPAQAVERLAAEEQGAEVPDAEVPDTEVQDAEVQAAEPQDVDVPPVVELEQQFDVVLESAADADLPTTETPLVQALHEAAPALAGAEHPVAAPVALDANDHVELPVVTPLETKPPVKEQRRTPRPRK